MIYDAKKEIDIQRANSRLKYLIEKKKLFEIIEKKERRSISQNNYLHLIFSWFAIQTGYTEEEVKQEIFKKHINPSLFYEGEHGQIVKIERWRSTAELDTGEMTLAIDRFRDYSAKELGIYLPEPKDLAHLQEIEIEIKKQPQYL